MDTKEWAEFRQMVWGWIKTIGKVLLFFYICLTANILWALVTGQHMTMTINESHYEWIQTK